MRRYLILFGLMLLPQTAAAEALSPWVQAVLDKASNGISTAAALPVPSSCDDKSVADGLTQNLSAVRTERLIALDLGVESQFLKERTICLESDRVLLQKKINELYAALQSATLACNARAAEALRQTFEFTATAYKVFLRGSVDASFSGSMLRYNYPFESVSNLENMTDPVLDLTSTAPQCVFTTDYAPHFVGGLPGAGKPITDVSDKKSYGCDKDVLAQIRDALPASMQTEADDLKDFQLQSNTVASDLYSGIKDALSNIETTIAILTGKPVPEPDPAASAPLTHGKASGCLRPLSPEPRSGEAPDAALFDEVLSVFPDFFRESNLRTDAATNTQTYDPALDLLMPSGTLFRLSYDFFGMLPNATILGRAFNERRGDIGVDRPLPSGSDFQDEGANGERVYLQDTNAWLRETAAGTESFMGAEDAILKDAYERTLDAVGPLDEAVQALGNVTEKFLPQEYIPSLAYFLRRSCVDGHCSALLENVAKRTFNPYCHPYLSGKYTDEKAADKCFCTSEFAGEDYCLGGGLHLDDQPPTELQCGETIPSSSSSSSSSL